MTIGYMRKVRTSGLIKFGQLLFLWKASVWKNVGKELFIWIVGYLIVSGVYRFQLRGTPSGDTFEEFVLYCNSFGSEEPLLFLLGFYVTLIARRWWNIYMHIPWPDNIAITIATFLRSSAVDEKPDENTLEKAKTIRKTMVRYLMVALVLVLRDISKGVKMRFPEMKHLVDFGLLTEEEKQKLDAVTIGGQENECVCKYWMPMQWISTMLYKCYCKKMIDEKQVACLVEKVLHYRTQLNDLLSYDWVGIPLVYTQVVNLAVVIYFIVALFSCQYIGTNRFPKESYLQQDYVIPFFTILQFIFYFGWLKVAQMMLNPFGMDDDDDFECNFIIDRHKEISLLMVDGMYGDCPTLVDEEPVLKHTLASLRNTTKTTENRMIGSTANMFVGPMEAVIVLPQTDYFAGAAHTCITPSEDGTAPSTRPVTTKLSKETISMETSAYGDVDKTQRSMTINSEEDPL